MRSFLSAVLLVASSAFAAAPATQPLPEDRGAWATAWKEKKPMTAEEARAFMKRLAQFVYDHHLKKDANSPQKGITYEYLDIPRLGKPDQFVQGEALDTMHDGAWLAIALANAYRATGDKFYKEWLTDYTLPFYLKMLNHSDTLFSTKQVWVDPKGNKFNKEHLLQDGEKGFVPYWWDDGASVSLECRLKKQDLPEFQAFDQYLADGKPNPDYRLSGYSIGSSNHLAQDLGLMLMNSWLLLRESEDPKDKQLTAELLEAAKNLQQCRTNHGFGNIPAVVAPLAVMTGDKKWINALPDPASEKLWEPNNHYTRALRDFKPGQKMPLPGFADDQEYFYYSALARAGGKLPDPAAFKLIYDAYTEPQLYRFYSDDAEVPPGINVFDLHPYSMIDGKFPDYRSDRKGPAKKPRPIGSRMGPQNMVCTAWALQVLKDRPSAWDIKREPAFAQDVIVPIVKKNGNDGAVRVINGALSVDIGVLPAGFVFAVPLGQAARIDFFNGPDAKGNAAATIEVDTNGNASGGKAQVLRLLANPPVAVVVPFTVNKDSKPSANCVEHGHYSVRVGDKVRNFHAVTSITSLEEQLNRELTGGLRTWEAIFDEKGYIPTGMGTNSPKDNFSDTGGYAHLISATAEYILLLEGKKDWETLKIPSR